MSDAPFDLVDARDGFADSDWFHACRQTQTPYVVIRSGETSADVLWDYVTLPPCCDERLHGNFPALERDARAIFDRFAMPESYIRIKPTMICFDRLPFDHAKRAAAELYGLIASYLPAVSGTAAHESASDAETPFRDQPLTPWSNSRLRWVEETGSTGTA